MHCRDVASDTLQHSEVLMGCQDDAGLLCHLMTGLVLVLVLGLLVLWLGGRWDDGEEGVDYMYNIIYVNVRFVH